MATNEELLARIRAVFADEPEVWEIKMFGGVAFMVEQGMACGVTKQARASVAAVIPGCSSSSNSATYCDRDNPTDFKAALLARTIACSARLTSMPRRS